MSEPRRQLRFQTEDEVIADVERLRACGCRPLGNWSLEMTCWHLGAGAKFNPPASPTPTPQQAAMKKAIVDLILETGKPPPNFETPPQMAPPPDAGDDAVDRFLASLRQLKAWPHALVDFGPFGPVPAEQVRQFTLLHVGHHLGFLVPEQPARREGLQYADEEAVIADVQALRRGCVRGGAWSLPQACHHLAKAVRARMQPGPFPDDTPEHIARRDLARQILASGKLPDGITSPENMLPAAEAGDEAIEALIAALRELKAFPGPIAPHRIFGRLSDADARRLNLIHCAHHLSYLSPRAAAPSAAAAKATQSSASGATHASSRS